MLFLNEKSLTVYKQKKLKLQIKDFFSIQLRFDFDKYIVKQFTNLKIDKTFKSRQHYRKRR